MFPVIFFILAILCTLVHLRWMKKKRKFIEVLFPYIMFWNVGLGSLVCSMTQVFWGDWLAEQIGWAPGSPFEYEVGMANLSYGILGILSYWIHGKFRDAALLGWTIFLFGAFVGHIISYFSTHNTAPYNIGFFIWFYDLIFPIFVWALWLKIRKRPSF